ncbi:MAG: molybdate ABC transporter permease subunit [Cyanobacteria bacterium]|nr:molybdate ABC transporter permease subunit [Cyanobacteria bacterium CG_2015-16_32_12]NCO76978.1 molybdate ABC transporter permease subunit [Cyanobacteria bacterium CG_2015-22_32_23]NCQ04766.1 molybdate ABC transporter permease subunit [Cyanobacteria bacterium CG_2015-09_32_10]NCQ42965.1 molybdate ABC transporter permease subunit [Cyanobacteria bacterium CG_2015-04_32_10]NCS85062.1 molybdate ABC transporter permease subunit [Cyanobacteria bacterium CG_2015-02_32_10]
MTINLSPLWISLKVSLLATIITFILGVIIAYQVYQYKGKWRSLIETILLIPLVLPPTIVGFLILILLGKNTLIGKILSQWNFNIIFTWYGAVIACIIIGFPLMFRATLGTFEQIDSLLLDAARIEGASEIAVFYYISLPLAFRGILAGIILSFTRVLGEFGATLMVAGNIPNKTQTIPMAIYFAVQAGEFKEGWFWVIILLFFSFFTIFLLNNLSR